MGFDISTPQPAGKQHETNPLLLDWRVDNDKDGVLSDWTIKVVTQTNENDTKEQIQIYHVHRLLLGHGPRQCGYFSTLFRHDSFSESKQRKSCIEFPQIIANNFPAFLDYMYENYRDEASVYITTESAVALKYLGSYFMNDRLVADVETFFRNDLNGDTLATYFAHATQVGDEEALKELQKYCTSKILEFDEPPKGLTLSFWMSVFENVEVPDLEENIFKMGWFVCRFCKSFLNELKKHPAIFYRLARGKHVPFLNSEIATNLLEIETTINPKIGDVLTKLEEHCLDIFDEHWVTFNQDKVQSLFAVLVRQGRHKMIMDFMVRGIGVYEVEVQETKTGHRRHIQRLKHEHKKELKRMAEQVEKAKVEINRQKAEADAILQQETDKLKGEMKKARQRHREDIQKIQAEKEKYLAELRCYRPLPEEAVSDGSISKISKRSREDHKDLPLVCGARNKKPRLAHRDRPIYYYVKKS